MKLLFFFFSSFLLSFLFGFCFLLLFSGVWRWGGGDLDCGGGGGGEREGLRELGLCFSTLFNILITVITIIYYDDYFCPSLLLEVFLNRL